MNTEKNVNVANLLSATEVKKTFLGYTKTSADEAYARLKIVRETRERMGIELNAHTRAIPIETRDKYEQLYSLFNELERMEAWNVTNGD